MRSVLISYSPVSHLERNKVFTIPDDCPDSDVDYLAKQCRKFFSFGTNVSLSICLQRYDPEWDSYIDLDYDSVIMHKEKLRLIVSPSLNDSITSGTSSVTDGDFASNEVTTGSLVVDTVHEEPNFCKKRKISIDEDDVADFEVSGDLEHEDTKLVIPQVVRPMKIDEQPLPDPFPLPRHFTSEVEVALSSQKMTKETNSAFLSAIASAMLSYKRYPSREEYTRVAIDIIRTYPFMKPPNGSPTGGIVQSLIDRFKQFRRKKKERPSITSSDSSTMSNRAPSSSVMPPKCIGEDESSFESHNKLIRAEMKKSRGGNMTVIHELIRRSYPMRRKDILTTPRDVSAIFEKYPFLMNLDHIMTEMEYVCEKDRLRMTVRDHWSNFLAPKIIEHGEREKHSMLRLRTQMEHMCIREGSVRALCILPYLVCDKMKPDHEKIVHIAPESCDPQAIVHTKKQKEPFILLIGDTPSQVFLIIDQEIVCEIKDCNDSVLALLSSFHVFNICYTKGCYNLFCFLEMQLLGMNPKKVPASVSHFLSRLA